MIAEIFKLTQTETLKWWRKEVVEANPDYENYLEEETYAPIYGGYSYLPAKKPGGILFIAHADTVWDGQEVVQAVEFKNGIYYSRNPQIGIGADDRAGIYMLYKLLGTFGRDCGYLVTTDEEYGCLGAESLVITEPETIDHFNMHYNFAIQLDRRGRGNFVCYNKDSREFRRWLQYWTGYREELGSFSDIAVLFNRDFNLKEGEKRPIEICSANFSVGFMCEHTNQEILVLDWWNNTLKAMKKLKFRNDIDNIKFVR